MPTLRVRRAAVGPGRHLRVRRAAVGGTGAAVSLRVRRAEVGGLASPNQAPTCTVIADSGTVEAGAAFGVTIAGIDSDGTIVSFLARVAQMSNGVPNPPITVTGDRVVGWAPITEAGTLITLACRAGDDQGTLSDEKLIGIVVRPTTRFRKINGVRTPVARRLKTL